MVRLEERGASVCISFPLPAREASSPVWRSWSLERERERERGRLVEPELAEV
jgi:hypothetical protein